MPASTAKLASPCMGRMTVRMSVQPITPAATSPRANSRLWLARSRPTRFSDSSCIMETALSISWLTASLAVRKTAMSWPEPPRAMDSTRGL